MQNCILYTQDQETNFLFSFPLIMILLEVGARNQYHRNIADLLPLAPQRHYPDNSFGKAHKVCSFLLKTNENVLKYCRPSSLDVQFVDYDGVRFHLTTPERKTGLLLSMHIRCWDELVRYGAMDVLKREYGALLAGQAEPEYNVSLEIDLEQVPADPGVFGAIITVEVIDFSRRSRRLCDVDCAV